MKIIDRYYGAVNSSNLKSRPETVMSDTDVLGAMGVADRRLSAGEDQFRKHPLAVPLERLFAGDSKAGTEIVAIMSETVRNRAKSMRIDLTASQAKDISRAVLAWYRQGACPACGGHGYKLIPGTKTIGDAKCVPCVGSGKVQIERLFRVQHRELVRWIMAMVESEACRAGPAAMKAIAPSLDLP